MAVNRIIQSQTLMAQSFLVSGINEGPTVLIEVATEKETYKAINIYEELTPMGPGPG